MTRKARVHQIFSPPLDGESIEARSFEIIDREAPSHTFLPAEWRVVRRMIHTTGDFSIMGSVRFSPDAITAGVAALRLCRPLYVDANMIRSGLSLDRLRRAGGR